MWLVCEVRAGVHPCGRSCAALQHAALCCTMPSCCTCCTVRACLVTQSGGSVQCRYASARARTLMFAAQCSMSKSSSIVRTRHICTLACLTRVQTRVCVLRLLKHTRRRHGLHLCCIEEHRCSGQHDLQMEYECSKLVREQESEQQGYRVTLCLWLVCLVLSWGVCDGGVRGESRR